MTVDLFIALLAFSVAAFFTPGPNNLMLMASGMNYGARRTMPHLLGVDFGFGAMLAIVGLGLKPVFDSHPWVFTALKVLGTCYLLYLAWKIATAGQIKDAKASGRPFTFLQAAAFQWVNPKAWGIAIGIITAYVPQENFVTNVLVISLLMALFGVPASGTWVLFGTQLRRWLKTEASVRYFNVTMALLLVASLYPVLRDVYLH